MNLQISLKILILIFIFGAENLYAKDMFYKCPRFKSSYVDSSAFRAKDIREGKLNSIILWNSSYNLPYSLKSIGFSSPDIIVGAARSLYEENVIELKKVHINRCLDQITLQQKRCWEVSLAMEDSPYQIDQGHEYSQATDATTILRRNNRLTIEAVRKVKGKVYKQLENIHNTPFKVELKVLDCRPVEYTSKADEKTRSDLNSTINNLESNYHQQSVNVQNIEQLQKEVKALREELNKVKTR